MRVATGRELVGRGARRGRLFGGRLGGRRGSRGRRRGAGAAAAARQGAGAAATGAGGGEAQGAAGAGGGERRGRRRRGRHRRRGWRRTRRRRRPDPGQVKSGRPPEAEVGGEPHQHHHQADEQLPTGVTSTDSGHRQIVVRRDVVVEGAAHDRAARLAAENVVVVEIGRHVRARRRRGARRLRPRGTRAPSGGGRPISLRDDVEEGPQLVDVAEAPPGAAGGTDAIGARHAPLDHPLLQGLRISKPVGLPLFGGEHPRRRRGRRPVGLRNRRRRPCRSSCRSSCRSAGDLARPTTKVCPQVVH